MGETAGSETAGPPHTSPLQDFAGLVLGLQRIRIAPTGEDTGQRGLRQRDALGQLDTLATWLAACQGRAVPRMNRPQTVIFAGSHGVAQVTYPGSAPGLAQGLIQRLQDGSAAANHIAGSLGAGLKVFDLATDQPTGDITLGPAMSERECAAALAFGMEAVADAPDALAVGEIGVGGGVAAAALAAALFGGDPEYWSRVGVWAPVGTARTKADAVAQALKANRGRADEPLHLLARLGGREIAATAGAIVAARHQNIPVVLDGFVTCVAAAVLHEMNPAALDHCIAGHVSAEPAHRALLDRIDKAPLLDLGIRFGEGIGSTLAFSLLRAACAVRETDDV